MKFLDLTLPTLAENLALDEALLESAEQSALAEPHQPAEVLRLWESPQVAVVLGRSSKIDDETRRDCCRRLGVPIIRRCSGGASVVIGPGCLMYAVVLSYKLRPQCRMLDQAHALVMKNMAEAVSRCGPPAEHLGTCDLVRQNRKFSGNAMRCKTSHFLYHGTILYDFSLPVISKLLAIPPRMPEYRQSRSHEAFVGNLSVPLSALRESIAARWKASAPLDEWPQDETRRLASEKYALPTWNERL